MTLWDRLIAWLTKDADKPHCLEGHRTLVDNATTFDVFKGVSI